MKVTGNKIGGTLNGVEGTKSNKTDAKSKTSDTSKTSQADLKGSSQVNVSERAQSMQKAKEIASNQTVDEAKVARLQKLIDEGKYNVSASAVADKLVDEHLLFPD